MENLVTQSNIMFVLGLIGIGYTVFKSIYIPQQKSETNDLLTDQKANFLRDQYDKRFVDIQTHISELTATNQNHIHTIDTKIDALTAMVNQMGKDIIKLETIIQERVHK